jgi:NagD protein
MLRGLLSRHGLAAEQMAMVGDRLYTDVEMARRAGAFGVLVLTGEATLEDAKQSASQPDLIAVDLAELGDRLAQSRRGL